jgi:predicted phosphodiesterase
MKKLLILIALLYYFDAAYGEIIMKPYLQAVTTNSVWVMVECSTKDTVIVNYGSTSSYGSNAKTWVISATTASPVTYIHKIKLTGLSPDTKYFYETRQDKSLKEGASFHTAVNPGTNFRFAWMADCRTGTLVHDSIAKMINSENPLFSLYGGDLCINTGYRAWKEEFFRPNQLDLISQVPFFNSPGNHEGWSENARAFLQNPDSTSGTQDYYSFDYGDLHVLCINFKVPYHEGSPQYLFAKADLKSTKKTWKIVISHPPAYVAGGHGPDKGMIELTKKIFEPFNVDMVISGHSHLYQHNLVNGIHHLIIGSAGAPLTKPGTASYTLRSVKDYNYAIGEVTPQSLQIKVYNASGKKLDSVSLTREIKK